jgi:hypothetical protein
MYLGGFVIFIFNYTKLKKKKKKKKKIISHTKNHGYALHLSNL